MERETRRVATTAPSTGAETDKNVVPMRERSDTIIAIFLLVGCGALMVASFEIREPDYGQLSPATWPRVVVAVLTLLSFIYLIKSLRGTGPHHTTARDNVAEILDKEEQTPPSLSRPGEFFKYWQNVIWCFALFLIYLLTLPWLGMLVGATLFVFLLLNALGGWTPRLLLLHAAIAVVSVGGMWSLFSFGLGVMLPTGEFFGRF